MLFMSTLLAIFHAWEVTLGHVPSQSGPTHCFLPNRRLPSAPAVLTQEATLVPFHHLSPLRFNMNHKTITKTTTGWLPFYRLWWHSRTDHGLWTGNAFTLRPPTLKMEVSDTILLPRPCPCHLRIMDYTSM